VSDEGGHQGGGVTGTEENSSAVGCSRWRKKSAGVEAVPAARGEIGVADLRLKAEKW
jgi:hypothetical protein